MQIYNGKPITFQDYCGKDSARIYRNIWAIIGDSEDQKYSDRKKRPTTKVGRKH